MKGLVNICCLYNTQTNPDTSASIYATAIALETAFLGSVQELPCLQDVGVSFVVVISNAITPAIAIAINDLSFRAGRAGLKT